MATDGKITEATLQAFERLTADQLARAMSKQGLKTDGKEPAEMIAELAAAGYDPLKPVVDLLPVIFLSVRSCDEVNKVNASIKAKSFHRSRLPLVDRFGRLQPGFRLHSIPCKPSTAKKLLEGDKILVGFNKLQPTLDAIREDPDNYDFTWCTRLGKDTRTGNRRPYVTLHAQIKGFDIEKELEKYQVHDI